MSLEGFAAVGDTKLYYEVRGTGDPLVLLHGHPLDSRMWDWVMDELAKEYQVIRFDMRGLGKSVDPGEPFTLYEDTYRLLQELHVERAHVAGCSFGSYAGVEFALAYPQMVRSLTLICPGGFSGASADRQQFIRELQTAIHSGNIEEACELTLHLTLDGVDQERGRAQQHREWLRAIYADIYLNPQEQTMPTWLSPNPRERIHEIVVPTLVMSGEYDHADFRQTADMLAASIPGSTYVKLPNTAHFPMIDSPEEFCQAMLSFLRA